MSDQYYPWYAGDYQRDTADLSLLEHGAYRVLLDHYYIHKGLPSDYERLFRITNATKKKEKTVVILIVKRFFKENGKGGLQNNRADQEIEKRDKFLKEQARKSALGVTRRLEKKQPEGQPMGQSGGEPLPSPSPSPKEALKKEPVSPDFPSNHYSDKTQQKYVDPINEICKKIMLEKINPEKDKARKSFKPYQWVQRQINNKGHPGAIIVTLERVYSNWSGIKEPWGYANKIMGIEHSNFYQKEHQDDIMEMDKEYDLIVKGLEQLFKSTGKDESN